MIQQPMYGLLAIPALLLLLWLLKKDFFPTKYLEQQDLVRRTRTRYFLLVTRTLILLCLIGALMHPVLEYERFVDKNPEITVLIDNSSSMELLDTSVTDTLLSELDARVPTRTRTIGAGLRSSLGDDVLQHLEPGRNLLLVTDGQVTAGATLQDVSTYAGSINATLNAVSLAPVVRDAAVRVLGGQKAVEDVNASYSVVVSATHDSSVPVELLVDEVLVDTVEVAGVYEFLYSLPRGEHVITARIVEDDAVSQNNLYRHTVTVVERPRVLYVTQKTSGVEDILDELYRVDVRARMPDDLRPYYAVITNDLSVSAIGDAAPLSAYLLDGNGLLVIGGEHSYDRGGYTNSLLETLLPVRVGAGERSLGGANIIVAIDLSGSTRGSVRYEQLADGSVREVQGSAELQSLQKGLAISLIEDLNPSNKVGVLGFTYPQQFAVSGCSGACVISTVEVLGKNKQSVIDKIATVDITGGTSLGTGMEGAIEMLRGVSGSKNIILITDGISSAEDEARALTAARTVRAQGGKVYAIQVGDDSLGGEYLMRLASAGGGIYFSASRANRLTALFGEPVSIDQGDAFDIFALNEHHFITEDLSFQGTLYGYNQVAPKTAAQLLVTSNGGDPVLTVWNFGIGRSASITAFNGPDLGELLAAPDSKVLSRTVNWLIGDPERKNSVVVDAPDVYLGDTLRVLVHAKNPPDVDGLSFSLIGKELYEVSLKPEAVGVFELLGTEYAVNYPEEYVRVGFSQTLDDDLLVSGGAVFNPGDVDAIVEHVKTLQQLTTTEEEDLRWWLLLFALVVYMIDVGARRIAEMRRR